MTTTTGGDRIAKISRTTMTPSEAEAFTIGVGHVAAGTAELILFAYRNDVPAALGLTLPVWVETRLGGYVKLAAAERRAVALRLHDDGLTQREIAGVLGVGQATVGRDLAEPNGSSTPAESAESEPDGSTHVAHNSGQDGWYTPPDYIEAAVAALGAIDLDPASSDDANAVVGAARYYTAEDDGLGRPWSGRVWLNPPYGQPWVDRFCSRLVREYETGTVPAAVALVNNGTETGWFQDLCAAAAAVCFPRGRISFWQPGVESRQPLQGQAIFYLGGEPERFRAAFVRFGVVR